MTNSDGPLPGSRWQHFFIGIQTWFWALVWKWSVFVCQLCALLQCYTNHIFSVLGLQLLPKGPASLGNREKFRMFLCDIVKKTLWRAQLLGTIWLECPLRSGKARRQKFERCWLGKDDMCVWRLGQECGRCYFILFMYIIHFSNASSRMN